jgi:enoyl-CoA hydratase
MFSELAPAFENLIERPDVKVIVIASALEDYFNTGADVGTFATIGADGMREWVEGTHAIARLIRGCPKPVLAAINGVAVGGGLEMTLHADLRFAAADVHIGMPEINIAFIPPIAGTQGLVRLVGRSQAFKILYGGELMDAAAAKEIGLVDFVVPPDKLAAEVQDYAAGLAQKPGNTLAAIRRCLTEGGAMAFEDGLAIERAEAIALSDHANFREGVAAFLQKRGPDWV